MAMHEYKLLANWKQGLDGYGTLKTRSLAVDISVPTELGGQGIGTNPEDLILSASASCYVITLAAILQYQKISFSEIQIECTAVFDVTQTGPVLKQIHHVPVVLVTEQSADTTTKIENAFHIAEQSCMVAKAFNGNINLTVRGTVRRI